MSIFGKDPTPQKATPQRAETRQEKRVSYVGPDLLFDGKLTGGEAVVVEGEVRGEIDLGSSLRVGPQACVKARVHARSVTVEGRLEGDISAEERVELVASASVTGNIRSPRITVAEGARFQGSVDMNAPEKSRKGEQKSKSEETVHATNRS